MNKRHYEHTLPNIRGSLSNTYAFISVMVREIPTTMDRRYIYRIRYTFRNYIRLRVSRRTVSLSKSRRVSPPYGEKLTRISYRTFIRHTLTRQDKIDCRKRKVPISGNIRKATFLHPLWLITGLCSYKCVLSSTEREEPYIRERWNFQRVADGSA